jgi:acid phosphatase (class A)
MGQLGKSNLNLNLNLNLGAAGAATTGGPPGVRINTEEFRKLVNLDDLARTRETVNEVKYREFWDPELQANVYVNAFVRAHPDWLGRLIGVVGPKEQQLRGEIDEQLKGVLDAAPERESRFAEIIHQDSSEGAISYWSGMIMLVPAAAPATTLLIRVARRIGELVVVGLKHHYRFPRPSQLCPAIVPMMDPPAHPSFPSGHSLQSRLISLCLQRARRGLPQADSMLADLAERIGWNRVISGVHYPLDHEAGVDAANACFEMLTGEPSKETRVLKAAQKPVPAFMELVALAQREFSADAKRDPELKETLYRPVKNAEGNRS